MKHHPNEQETMRIANELFLKEVADFHGEDESAVQHITNELTKAPTGRDAKRIRRSVRRQMRRDAVVAKAKRHEENLKIAAEARARRAAADEDIAAALKSAVDAERNV